MGVVAAGRVPAGAVTLADGGDADGVDVEFMVCANTGAAISEDTAIIAENDGRWDICASWLLKSTAKKRLARRSVPSPVLVPPNGGCNLTALAERRRGSCDQARQRHGQMHRQAGRIPITCY
jgi:hypothetical protein